MKPNWIRETLKKKKKNQPKHDYFMRKNKDDHQGVRKSRHANIHVHEKTHTHFICVNYNEDTTNLKPYSSV